MKSKLGLVLFVLSPLAHAGGGITTNFEGCTPASTVFFAQHKNHEGAVEICKIKGGYRYTNGPLGEPTLQIVGSSDKFKRIPLRKGDGFVVQNGSYTYWLRQGEQGEHYLMATKGYPNYTGKPLADIPLDDKGWGYKNNLAKMDN